MPTPTLSSRRAAGNLIAAKQGVPLDQASIDSMWSGRAEQLNATMPPAPASSSSSTRPASRQGQASIDAMWTSLATGLNTAAGLKPPVADRAR
jgi:hypothetical protein